MSLSDLLDGDRRLVVLRSLATLVPHEANESVLQSCLSEYGHHASRDQVRTLLDWLSENGLVDLRDVGGTIRVASLTGRGLDVAEGRLVASGVKRPRPANGGA